MDKAPKSEGNAPPGGVDAQTLRRIDNLEKETEHLNKAVISVSDNNKFIVTVLFAAFIVIIVAIGVAVITLLITKKV